MNVSQALASAHVAIPGRRRHANAHDVPAYRLADALDRLPSLHMVGNHGRLRLG
ncbi:hypothetical protein [Xanthomonas arboricola]|uniref:hypothetical protein n=1 Tax=Xanthomonas arboricola TaxID=56448 RepID=UPI0015E44A4E|nr:hypothetical protein [Xanthomonas arboricola]